MALLITGATGPIGVALTRRLLADGAPVRAITRRADAALPEGADVVIGDFTSGDLPAATFRDVEAAFVFPALGGVDRFLRQASDHGVERLVVLSSLAAARLHPRDVESTSADHHESVERAVEASGIPSAVLRPGDFANNLLFWAWPIRTTGVVRAPYADSAQAPIHEADVADVAATLLQNAPAPGTVVAMTGPEAITRRNMLRTIGAAIGRDLVMEEITPEQFAHEMAEFMPPPIVRMLLTYWSDTVVQPDAVLSGVTDVTGLPGRTLAQWAHDHRADFT